MTDRKSTRRDKKAMFEAQSPKPASLNRDIQAKIGQRIRAMYDDVVDQGVPDRFVELLNQIETRENSGKKSSR